MPIRILLVDDHPMVLKGLSLFLGTREEMEIVGEANNGAEALEKVKQLRPDVVLMDLMMPVMDGVEATRRIKEIHPDVKVVVLTSFSDQDHVLPAIRAGAEGYQLKEIEAEELVATIRAAHQGKTQLHPQAAGHLVQQFTSESTGFREQDGLEVLTPREQEVLRLITEGMSNKEIAANLVIAEKTVKTHVSGILNKLDLQDRTQAAIHAMKQGWFT
ncbi:response regulator [Kroppenstedtia eburnea]|uniref:Two component transcriptional regulator, LuxR family n=1 Tax=Kroppenstedtia eburnea TaxID=714067 RepID=A0A1N7LHD0_9BACL|nr:response regulator transcription factor [Kroppenstedtia eburnea]EGK07738.1 DNA-binding response regulator [Desmospora sp. 8437]QKI81339.1 response regulator transcription factor [Kroppenstedtia eburnea]SIS73245.1 two component transcriptional regulator, LuxR family [Kroppenstedtia eburnea]